MLHCQRKTCYTQKFYVRRQCNNFLKLHCHHEEKIARAAAALSQGGTRAIFYSQWQCSSNKLLHCRRWSNFRAECFALAMQHLLKSCRNIEKLLGKTHKIHFATGNVFCTLLSAPPPPHPCLKTLQQHNTSVSCPVCLVLCKCSRFRRQNFAHKVPMTGGFWSVPAGFWWVLPGSCFSKHVTKKRMMMPCGT